MSHCLNVIGPVVSYIYPFILLKCWIILFCDCFLFVK